MSTETFYEDLLTQIAVPKDDIHAARKKRDELGAAILGALRDTNSAAIFYPAGALAAGTQIRPLNDVDVVVELPNVPTEWIQNPRLAMTTIQNLMRGRIQGKFELSTHAIKDHVSG